MAPRLLALALLTQIAWVSPTLAAPIVEGVESCDNVDWSTQAGGGETIVLLSSPRRTEGAGSLDVDYQFKPSKRFGKVTVLERTLPAPVDLRDMAYFQLDLLVVEPGPGFTFTVHLVDDAGFEARWIDQTTLGKATPSWIVKTCALSDLQKSRWSAGGNAINLRKITRIALRFQNDAELTAPGSLRFLMDHLRVVRGDGLRETSVVAEFESYKDDAALASVWRLDGTSAGQAARLDSPEMPDGGRCLLLQGRIATPGVRIEIAHAFAEPRSFAQARYLRMSVFGDPPLDGLSPAAHLILTDDEGNRVVATARKWPGRAEWADVILPFQADGIEGLADDSPKALEWGGKSCWREDYGDGKPWKNRTNLSRIVGIALGVSTESEGRYPVEAAVRFDRIVVGNAMGEYRGETPVELAAAPAASSPVSGLSPAPGGPSPSSGAPVAGAAPVSAAAKATAPLFLSNATVDPTPSGAVTVAGAPAVARRPLDTASPAPAVTWLVSNAAAVEAAKRAQKPVLLYFRQAGTRKCEEFEKACLEGSDFSRRSQRFTCLYEDLGTGRYLADYYKVYRVPDLVLIDKQGGEAARFSGGISPEALFQAMDGLQ